MYHDRPVSKSLCQSDSSLAGNNSQSTGRPRETPHRANRVAVRCDRLGSVAGPSDAVLGMETQRSARPSIPTKDEARQAAELTLQYFQRHLDSLSTYELNLLYQLRHRLQ
jgi:hypothetical protein